MELGVKAKRVINKAVRSAKRLADKGVKEVKAAAGDKSAQKLKQWQEWYKDAVRNYQPQLDLMDIREDLYAGSRAIPPGPNARRGAVKEATVVMNFTAELIESQANPTIAYPKVTPKRKKDEGLARSIEAMLLSEIDRLPLEAINDEHERTCPIQGGAWFYVDWDNTVRTHTTVGAPTVIALHPKQVIPQEGVKDIHKGKRCFIRMSLTKEYVKERWGVDVSDESEEEPDIDVASANNINNPPPNKSKVTVIIGFEKKKGGGIGRFIWVNETVIEDLEDYQARIMEVCAGCGAEKPIDGDVCPACGKKKWKKVAREYEILTQDIQLPDGRVIPAYQPLYQDGQIVLDPQGKPVPDINNPTKIPYYKPNCFPLVLRKNVSVYGKLLGDSDVDKVADLQYLVNKLGTKMAEKLLKGGSLLMKHRNVSIKTDDSELKVVNVNNEMEAAVTKVLTLQPNISYDASQIEAAHNTMREILGITPSFQGLPDKTATSGIAKQVAAAQTAGRLESRRRMKDFAFSELYQMLFKFMLAFSDEPRLTVTRNEKGEMEYGVFDRYQFLEQDVAGEWYYNDEFTFSVDPSGGLAANREAMWQENRMNYQQGAYGPVGSPQSLYMFWTNMERLHYPGASENKMMAAEMYKQALAMQQQQMLLAMEQEKTKQLQIMAKQPMPPGAFGGLPEEEQEGAGTPAMRR